MKLLPPPQKRTTLDEILGKQKQKIEYVELCNVYCAFANELPNKEIKVIVEKNLAYKIIKGEATVDALDPMFIALPLDVKNFIKGVIQSHIDKIKNDFFKRMQ